MPVYIVTGKLGNGKGLCSIGRMRDYLGRGKPVATNMDIFPEEFRDKSNKDLRIIRLPDRPTKDDLFSIGRGNDSKDEDENGALILDEGATWFNAQDYRDKDRKGQKDFFYHARKLGWDVYFQIQDMESMDAQTRRAIGEYEAVCQKVRAVHIPVISPLFRLFTGKAIRFPKHLRWHKVRIINQTSGVVEESFRYQGRDLWPLYDTSQIFKEDYDCGPFTYLTPWHLVGRYQQKGKLTLAKVFNALFWHPIIKVSLVIAYLISPSTRRWVDYQLGRS